MTSETPGLVFEPGPHRYTVGGHELPSVTRICGVVGEMYRGVPNAALEAARDRGEAVHYATELHDLGELDEAPVPESIVPYLQAYKDFRRETGFEPTAIEMRVWHPALRYAGTLDRVGHFTRLKGIRAGWECLVDLKATYSVMPQVHVQTALYAAAYDRMLDLPPADRIKRRFALQLRADATYRLEECADPTDLSVGLAAKTIHEWRQRHAA